MGVLTGIVLLISGINFADKTVDQTGKALRADSAASTPAPKTSTLSDNAEYPTPVIQLQQLLADGVKQQTPVLTHSSDFQDNKTDRDTDDIEALRQRLSALKAQNNNN